MNFIKKDKRIKNNLGSRKDNISITGLSIHAEWLILVIIFGAGILTVVISAVLSQFYFSEIIISDEDTLISNKGLAMSDQDIQNIISKIDAGQQRLNELRGITEASQSPLASSTDESTVEKTE